MEVKDLCSLYVKGLPNRELTRLAEGLVNDKAAEKNGKNTSAARREPEKAAAKR